MYHFSLPPPAALSIEASWAGFSAVFAPVSWLTGTRSIHLITLSLIALAVAITSRAKSTVTALATPGELLTWRVVAGALVVTATTPPAWLTDAVPCLLVTLGIVAAVAGAGTLETPPVWLTGALACFLVTLAMLTEANVLTLEAPAVGIACALACDILALAIGVAVAHFLTIRTPELAGTFCKTNISPQYLVGHFP